MRKRKTRAAAIRAEAGGDYGPALRLGSDGRVVAWGGAAVVEIENRDDPELADRRRAVRGARRRDALRDLLARKVITKRMLDAAEQFLEDCSIASGSTACDSGLKTMLGPRAGLPERQVMAMTRIIRVRHMLGLLDGMVFWWVVFDNRSLNEFETLHRLRSGSATALLQQALDGLDRHYHRTALRNSA